MRACVRACVRARARVCVCVLGVGVPGRCPGWVYACEREMPGIGEGAETHTERDGDNKSYTNYRRGYCERVQSLPVH